MFLLSVYEAVGEASSGGWSHDPQQEEGSFQAAQGSHDQEPRVLRHFLRPAHLLLCVQRVPLVRVLHLLRDSTTSLLHLCALACSHIKYFFLFDV